MTTIAIDRDYNIAWDSQVTYGNIRQTAIEPKVIRNDECVHAYTGMQCDVKVLLDYLSGRKTRWPFPDGFEYTIVTITPDGKVWYQTEKTFNPVQINLPYAIGSGSDIALGAMYAGASAYTAVVIAAKLDVYTGGEINRMEWKEKVDDTK
jgi:ATP-dependent protease HslVU (ClpYQ) peptidase subunit